MTVLKVGFCCFSSGYNREVEDSADDRGRNKSPVFEIKRNIFKPTHPARARGSTEDLW